MKTFYEYFNTNMFDGKYAEECKRQLEAAEKEVNDRFKGRSHMTAAEARKILHESLFGKDEHRLADEELDLQEEQEIEELEEELECEVKLEKNPDPAKEEIFATCLNFLHTHTEDELYEIVRLAFKAAEVFGY